MVSGVVDDAVVVVAAGVLAGAAVGDAVVAAAGVAVVAAAGVAVGAAAGVARVAAAQTFHRTKFHPAALLQSAASSAVYLRFLTCIQASPCH